MRLVMNNALAFIGLNKFWVFFKSASLIGKKLSKTNTCIPRYFVLDGFLNIVNFV